MHIITGVLIAALAGRSGRACSRRSATIRKVRSGPLQVLHALPGRVRFRIPRLVRNEAQSQVVESQLIKLPGVDAIVVDRRTGSVLVRHDTGQISAEVLFEALSRLLALGASLDRIEPPAIVREVRSMGRSLNQAVHEETNGILDLWTGAMLALAAVGVHKMMTENRWSLPPGFTLVWWAFLGLFVRGGRDEPS